MMDWKKHFKDWKLIAALVLITLLCSEVAPHVEIFVPDFIPSTAVSVQVSGGYQTNVAAQIVSNHAWLTR
jgi:hypothetical protein